MNGFASDQFLDFASKNDSNILLKDYYKTIDGYKFPVYIKCQGTLNFLITPICFSGPLRFAENQEFKRLFDRYINYNIKGGFIQTREPIKQESSLGNVENYHFFKDHRINYRLPIYDKDQDWLLNMGRSARRYSKIIIKQLSRYKLEEVETFDRKKIKIFSELYNETSNRLRFEKQYRFNYNSWNNLLKSKSQKLYLLYEKNRVIAGTVITQTDEIDCLDYTFVTHDMSIKNIGRINLIKIVEYFRIKNIRYLDLGGGISDSDNLSRFKMEMGGIPTNFKRIRFVWNENDKEYENFNFLKARWP